MQSVDFHMRRTTDTACSLPMFTQIPPQTNGLRYGDDVEKELLMKICIKEQHLFNVRTVRGAFIGKNISFLHTRSTKEIHCCCYESEVCQLCPFKGSVVESVPGRCQGIPGTRLLDVPLCGLWVHPHYKSNANRRGIVILCTAFLCPNLFI